MRTAKHKRESGCAWTICGANRGGKVHAVEKIGKVMLILEQFHSQISGTQSGSLENWPLNRGDIVDPLD
jgi:hypothetical protein